MAQSHGYQSPRGETQEATTTSETDSRKRRRVAVACIGCRNRKTRCDGSRPKCSTCVGLNQDCIYQQPAQTLGARQSTEQSIESQPAVVKRLEALEETLSLLRRSIDSARFLTPGVPDSFENNRPGISAPGCDNIEDEDDPAISVSDKVDGMAAVLLNDNENGNDPGFFGASSNISLLEDINRAITYMTSLSPDSSAQTSQLLYTRNEAGSSSLDQSRTAENNVSPKSKISDNCFAVPPEEEAKMLIEVYFRSVGQMIPALDKDSFLQKFHTLLARGTRSVTRSWLALMNVVFAISTNIMASTSPTQELAEVSERYYHRALTLVMPSIIGQSNFQNLQLLALMGSYLQGTRHSTQAWTFHGLAVKSALELGLHTPEASKNLPPLEREMRKRCWYWILINDRILSANFGRPCMISMSTNALELPKTLSSNSQRSNEHNLLADAGVAMLNAVITLTEILSNAVTTLYGSNSGCSTAIETQDIICGIVRLTCELEYWKRDLPEDLYILTAQAVSFNENEPLELQRAKVLLTIRYLGVRILVLRPILREFLEHSTSDGRDPNKVVLLQSLGVPFLKDCVDSCVEVASMVEAILRVFRSGNEIMGAWWFSAYYTFNASLVIIGVLIVCKSSSYETCFTPEAVKDMCAAVNQAICVLQELDNGNIMIRKCREHLIILLQRYSSLPLESALYFAGDQRQSYDFGTSIQDRELFGFPGAFPGIDLMAHGNVGSSSFDCDLGAGMLDGSTLGQWI